MSYNIYCQECLDEEIEEAYEEAKKRGTTDEHLFDPFVWQGIEPTKENRPHMIMTGIEHSCEKHGGSKIDKELYKKTFPEVADLYDKMGDDYE